MKAIDRAVFHKLYAAKKPRAVYSKKDFLDYTLMIVLSAIIVVWSYGFGHIVSMAGVALCAFMLFTFMLRHGIEFSVPVILRKPQEILYMFVYKFQNLKPAYFTALGLLLLENVLIAATPGLPHHVELMRKIAYYLFYLHLLGITAYRTVILIDHLFKKELVREVLMQTAWQRAIKEDTNISLEIVHAYCTGVLTHIILLAPLYLVITYASFSVVFLPAVCLLNVMIHLQWVKVLNAWFYRDHWLGHNSEFEFVFLHGPHHDAIPSGLIAVAENGFVEGFLRHTLAFPGTFYNPVVSFLVYTYDVKIDIDTHQYIPGIFPRMHREFLGVAQHSTHHYGPIEPYSFGLKLDHPSVSEEFKKAYKRMPAGMRNSIELDEELTNFKWDNPTFRKILSLYDKYQA